VPEPLEQNALAMIQNCFAPAKIEMSSNPKRYNVPIYDYGNIFKRSPQNSAKAGNRADSFTELGLLKPLVLDFPALE